MNTDIDVKSRELKTLNEEIIVAHKKHYEQSPTGLVNPDEAPNDNTIYQWRNHISEGRLCLSSKTRVHIDDSCSKLQ